MATSEREKHQKELDAHFKARREQGLPAHRPQEHYGKVGDVCVSTLAGKAYVGVGVGEEAVLDQTALGNLILELQAAFQAVS